MQKIVISIHTFVEKNIFFAHIMGRHIRYDIFSPQEKKRLVISITSDLACPNVSTVCVIRNCEYSVHN